MKNNFKGMVKAVSKNKKACIALKTLATAAFVAVVTAAYSGYANAADLSGVVKPIVELINSFINPLLALVGAGGVLFCIMLGVKFATAEEPQEREKRKQSLKTAIIGYVLIFVLVVALKLSIGPLTKWMNSSVKGTNTSIELNTEKTTK